MSKQHTAGADDRSEPTGPRPPAARRATAALVALAAAVGIPMMAGSAAGSPGRSLATMGYAAPVGAPAREAALGGGAVACGGIRINPAALPGRPIGPAERSGPAEGVGQVLRLFEWTRHTPYDGVAWSVADAGNGTALLVAHGGPQDRYIPVHRQPDGHWQIDAPCHLEHTR
jgi:hypothetical protein